MYAAFIAVAAACGVPGLLVALAFSASSPTARFLLLTTVTVAALFTSVPVMSLSERMVEKRFRNLHYQRCDLAHNWYGLVEGHRFILTSNYPT